MPPPVRQHATPSAESEMIEAICLRDRFAAWFRISSNDGIFHLLFVTGPQRNASNFKKGLR
jgi:hypothetical protein